MDVEKAVEIIGSLGVINVTHNGKSVWLENVSETTNEAEVRNLDTNEIYKVDLSKLEES